VRVLGLDVAGTTGYSLLEIKENKINLLEYGTVKIRPKDKYHTRLIDLHFQIKDLIKKFKPDIVAIEELHSSRNVKTTVLLGMYLGVVYLAVPKNIQIEPVNANKARAAVVKINRKGKVKKEDVFEWAVKKYDLNKLVFDKDNDITDSILLSYFIAKEYIS